MSDKTTETAKLPPGCKPCRDGLCIIPGRDHPDTRRHAWAMADKALANLGMTRAGFKQCEQALGFVRMMAASEGEPNPDEDGDSFWRCVDDAREILAVRGDAP